MELWKAVTCDKKILLVEVVGWTEDDAIVEEFKTGIRFAFKWNIFFKQFSKLEPFDCDTSDYKGADLDRIMKKHDEE